MNITTNSYNTSINIVRDLGVDFNYISTSNAELVYTQILKNYNSGIRSFAIVGAYGTGKSAFLVALEKALNNKNNPFNHLGKIKSVDGFEVVPIIGEYCSIIELFAQYFDPKNVKDYSGADIIRSIEKHSSKKNIGLAIFVDEFGKLLEYAAKNNPEAELYFIQQLAELANDTRKNILFITTLHQGFNTYSRSLTKFQQQEWDKVRGRLIELTFNEPIEQLLFLASERLKDINQKEPGDHKVLFETIKNSYAFPLKDYQNHEIAKNLLPFDMLSAGILTVALQRYGQNQRSLFSFIDSSSHLNIQDYSIKTNPYYHLACVYDYLNYHFYSFLTTRYNPDLNAWSAIKTSLERVEALFDKEIPDAQKTVKAIGLINLLAGKGAKIDISFLENYCEISMGIKNTRKLIEALEKNKIIVFSKYNNRYKLIEGSDLNIELAIDAAGNLVSRVGNVVDYLNSSFDFPYILAKETFFTTGTPRFFGYELSDEPVCRIPEQESDGIINLIFSEELNRDDIQDFSAKCDEAILYGLYANTTEIKSLLFEIEKVKRVIQDNGNDLFAVKELNSILEHQKNLLNHYILENIYSSESVSWFFKGEELQIHNSRTLNKELSNICKEIYHASPIIKSELINRTRLSSAISTARKNLMIRLVNDWNKENLGFEEDKFPPEKTIYLTLLKETGIHQKNKNGFFLNEPKAESLKPLWNVGLQFLDSTKPGKKKVSDLVEILLCKPYKLKQGLIDFWIPIFLVHQKDNYALYENGIYIPEISVETLELITKKPDHYEIKAFDLDPDKLKVFNKYRELLNQIEESSPSNETFIETLRPFVVFYKSLNPYSSSTKKLSKQAIALRSSIADATDLEKAFFEDFPSALGYSLTDFVKKPEQLEEYIIQMRSCIQEINGAYDDLINRFEARIVKTISNKQLNFPEFKDTLIKRFEKVKKHLLLPKQKSLIQRIKSPLDERKTWLNSLAFALIGKSLENIQDEEEKVLYENFKISLYELDNLCELSTSDIDQENEEVFKIEITSFVEGLKKHLVRLPRQDREKINKIEEKLKGQLIKNDKDLNIIVLTKLLQKVLKDEY